MSGLKHRIRWSDIGYYALAIVTAGTVIAVITPFALTIVVLSWRLFAFVWGGYPR